MKKYCPQILIIIGLILTTIGGIWSAMKTNSSINDIRKYQRGQSSEVVITIKPKSILDLYNKIDNPTNQLKVFASVIGDIPAYNVLITGQQSGRAGINPTELFAFEAEKILPKSTIEIGSIMYPEKEEKNRFYHIRAYNGDAKTLTVIEVLKDTLGFKTKREMYSDFKMENKIEKYSDSEFK